MKIFKYSSRNRGFKRISLLALAALLYTEPSLISSSYPNIETVQAESKGSSFLKIEEKETQELQDGVKYSKIVYGKANKNDEYMVNVDFLADKKAAQKLKEKLDSEGYQSFIQTIKDRAQDDPEKGPLGYLVRVGPFKEETRAESLKNELASKGYSDSRTVFSAEDGDQTTGPWVVRVLEINPEKYEGRVSPVLATDHIPGKEKLTDLSSRMNALAGINGGYFVMGPKDGTEGDLAGVSMMNGELISEAVNGRTSLILEGDKASISPVGTKITIKTDDGARQEIDGLNREPGLIRGCGGVGDKETDEPKHDFTCTDSNELIQYSSSYGNSTPAGEGAEVVIDNKGIVTKVRDARGGEIPEGTTVLAGTEESALWIKQHLHIGEKAEITKHVYADGNSLQTEKGVGIINGGPRLLQNGKIFIQATAEGFHQPDNPEFYYQFGQRRHPRTIAGIKADGTLLLVTVDGRKPGYSVGANFEDSAKLLKSLGAVDAVNLDGGGSTTMTVNQELVSTPSDKTGERPVGDAILLLP